MKYFSFCTIINGIILLLLCACATPSSPGGGPPDEEGPEIIETEPETGTTNFDGRTIEFSFSEFIRRQSIREAILIEPDIGLGYSLDWGRKSVAIEFESELPDSTTIIVTVGTDLADTRGNKMTSPLRIAVSTGPEIDQGEISGKVLDAKTGKGSPGDRVFLYRVPVDLTQKADYLAGTDTSGTFHFSYLRQGDYKVIWVDDQNRSKIWERERERAQPFYRETVSLDKAGKDTLGTLYKAQSDTTKPEMQGVGLFSSRRIRLRFSENIALTDSTELVANDTLGPFYSTVTPLYIDPAEQYVLFAHSEKDLEAGRSYELAARNIKDLTGNLNAEMSMQFEGSSQQDTTLQRFIERKHPAGIFPDEPVEVVYAQPITEQTVLDSLIIVVGTKLFKGWENASADQNILRIAPSGTWQQAVNYEFRIWNPLSNQHKTFQPAIWQSVDLGGIRFSMADTPVKQKYNLVLNTAERGIITDTTFTGEIEIENLPPLTYQSIIFADLNGNGKWDPGQVEPYEAPEPYFIQNQIPVKGGFTGEVRVEMSD